MNKDALTAPEVAEILGIATNTVYAMVKRGELKCYMVGRKMRFTYAEIQRHIHGGAQVTVDSPDRRETDPVTDSDMDVRKTVVMRDTVTARSARTGEQGRIRICGKDEILDVLAERLNRRQPKASAERVNLDSYNSLISLYRNEVDAAACHMWDNQSDTYNTPYIRSFLPGCSVVVIHVAKRIQGFYVKAGNPKEITGWDDVKRDDLILANREPGAGTRILLDLHMQQLGIDPSSVRGYDEALDSHLNVAVRVAKGLADYGIGTEKTVRNMNGLDFIPMQQESYDLVVKKERLSDPDIRRMISVLQDPAFREQFLFMAGYDVSRMGEIREI